MKFCAQHITGCGKGSGLEWPGMSNEKGTDSTVDIVPGAVNEHMARGSG